MYIILKQPFPGSIWEAHSYLYESKEDATKYAKNFIHQGQAATMVIPINIVALYNERI